MNKNNLTLIRKIVNLDRKNNLKILLLNKNYNKMEKKYDILTVRNKWNYIRISKIENSLNNLILNDKKRELKEKVITSVFNGITIACLMSTVIINFFIFKN